MRILFLNHFFYPYFAGTEKYMLELGKRLVLRGHEVTVLTSRLQDTAPTETLEGIRVVRVPAKIYNWAPHPIPPPVPVMSNVSENIERLAADADIVHIHNRFMFGPKYGAIVKRLGKKLCLTIHNARPMGIDFLSDKFGQFYDDMFGMQLMNQCNGIIGVSRNALETTIPKDYAGKTTVIYNGVDGQKFAPAQKSKESKGLKEWKEKINADGADKKIILTNARLVPQKGVRHLIEAMQNPRLRTLDARLVVFGRGVLKNELEKQAKSIGADVLFISERISDQSLVDLYATASVFVLPSLFEPCPLVLLEAMACAKPIVATSIGGNPELIEHEKSGLLVPAGNAKAIADAVGRLLQDNKLAQRLGTEARRLAVERFTWEETTKRTEAFYKTL